jgi:hypothetical protein
MSVACQQRCNCGRVCERADEHEKHQCPKCDYDTHWFGKVAGTGAGFPCRRCGMSERNSIHCDRNRPTYHAFDYLVEEYSSFSQEALEEALHNLIEEVKAKTGATDDQIDEALAEVAKKVMNINCMKNPEAR